MITLVNVLANTSTTLMLITIKPAVVVAGPRFSYPRVQWLPITAAISSRAPGGTPSLQESTSLVASWQYTSLPRLLAAPLDPAAILISPWVCTGRGSGPAQGAILGEPQIHLRFLSTWGGGGGGGYLLTTHQGCFGLQCQSQGIHEYFLSLEAGFQIRIDLMWIRLRIQHFF